MQQARQQLDQGRGAPAQGALEVEPDLEQAHPLAVEHDALEVELRDVDLGAREQEQGLSGRERPAQRTLDAGRIVEQDLAERGAFDVFADHVNAAALLPDLEGRRERAMGDPAARAQALPQEVLGRGGQGRVEVQQALRREPRALHDEARAPAAVAQPVLDLVGPDQDASLGAGARGVGGACAGAVGPPELRARTPGVQRPHLGTVASGAL